MMLLGLSAGMAVLLLIFSSVVSSMEWAGPAVYNLAFCNIKAERGFLLYFSPPTGGAPPFLRAQTVYRSSGRRFLLI